MALGFEMGAVADSFGEKQVRSPVVGLVLQVVGRRSCPVMAGCTRGSELSEKPVRRVAAEEIRNTPR